MGKFTPGSDQMQILILQIHTCKFYYYVPCKRKVKFTHAFLIVSQYLLLDNEFPHVLLLTDYTTVAENLDIVAKSPCIPLMQLNMLRHRLMQHFTRLVRNVKR